MHPGMRATIRIEAEQEVDGRWLAEALELPGVMAYGATPQEAIEAAKGLALLVLGDQVQHHELEKPIELLEFSISMA